MSPTGGNIVQVADAGDTFGVEWPEYSAETQAALAQLLPGYGKVVESDRHDFARDRRARPLSQRARHDRGGSGQSTSMVPIFASGTKDDLQRGADFVASCEKVAAMLWVGGCTDDPTFTPKDLVKAGVPVYRDATPCMRAMRAAMDFGDYVTAAQVAARRRRERPAGIDREAAAARLRGCGTKLTEREAKAVLAAYGLPVTREKLAATPEEAARTRARSAAPVALKIDSPDIAHKTEAGAIRLGVQGDDAVRGAFAQVIEAARRYAPERDAERRARAGDGAARRRDDARRHPRPGVRPDRRGRPGRHLRRGAEGRRVSRRAGHAAQARERCSPSCAARSSSTACAACRRATRRRSSI